MPYPTLRRHVEQFARTLDTPAIDLVGSVEIKRIYVTAELKGRERDRELRLRDSSTHGRGTYADKPPVFTLVDRGSDQRYVVPAKSSDESTARLLLRVVEKEFPTVCTGEFRAYDPLDDDKNYQREAVLHDEGEYVDGDAHVNT